MPQIWTAKKRFAGLNLCRVLLIFFIFPSDSRGVGKAVPAGASRSADRGNEASGGTAAAGPDSAGENHHRLHGEDGQSDEAVASQG